MSARAGWIALGLCLATTVATPAWAQDGEDATEDETSAPEASADAEASGDDISTMKARLEAIEAMLSEQAAALEAQRVELAKQEAALAKQREGLTAVRLKTAKKSDWTFDTTGYYRARFHVFGAGGDPANDVPTTAGLYENQPTTGQYLNQRLRFGLSVGWKKAISFNVHAQALDNVLWGDNASLARTSLFAGNPSYTTREGTEGPNFEVFRAWMEFKIPVGQFRVGRMSSQWGLGILVNDGDGFRNDFGEAYYSNQFDRILFATRPVDIVQAITKKQEKNKIPLYLVIAFDRLVQDPLVEYYGYRCNPGVDRATDPDKYDARCDPNGDGVHEEDHSWTDDREGDDRSVDWWADATDDVNEMVYAVFYRGEGIKYFGGYGDLFAGVYAIHRWQDSSQSQVVILDGTLSAKVHGVSLEFEGLGILGSTRALTLPSSQAEDPILKQASISSYALRLGYERERFKVLFESGFASGDDNASDPLFTGRAMNPDYNVGLLLYEEVIARLTEVNWAGDASALASKGGVYNSHYLYPRVYLYPANNTKIILAGVVAFPHKADGAVFLCNAAEAASGNCSATEGVSDVLGGEVALAIKHRFYDRIDISIETAYAHATNRLPLASAGLNPDGHFWTLQGRAAFLF